MHRFIILLTAVVIAFGIGGCGGGTISSDPLGTDSITVGDVPQVVLGGSVSLTATVKNASGAAVVGRGVTFSIIVNQSGGTLYSIVANTNSSGVATVTYKAGTTNGVDVVRARISNDNYGDISITVGSGAGGGRAVSVTANPSTVAPGANSYILATVTDSNGSPVAGETVTFTRPVGTGAFATATTVTTNAQGAASATYTTGNTTTQEVVQATITGGIASTAIISKTGGTTGGRAVSVTANPSAVAPGENSYILATVTDSSGSPVAGETVTFTNLIGTGTFATTTTVTTNAQGAASATYTTGNTMTQEVVQATILTGGIASTAIISKTGGISGTRSIAVTANPTAVQPLANSKIVATVTDSSGKAVSGVGVTFSMITANGTIAPSAATTNAAGQASIVYTAGNNLLQDVVKAELTSDNTITAYVIVGRTAQAAGNRISISANPSAYTGVSAGVVLNSRILVTVTDNSGNPVAGETVTFTMVTANGTLLLPVVVTTDTDGKAVVVYQVTATGSMIQDVIRATLSSNGATDVVIVTVQ